jgi:hypothetical protein
MSNNFCKHLSTGYSFSVNNDTNLVQVKPCCWFQDSFNLDEHIHENRKKYNEITDWVPQCEICKTLEDCGQQSLRQSSFDWGSTNDHTDPVSVDIYLDNTCNAACVTCNQSYSTLWYKEKQKLFNKSFRIESKTSDINTKIQQISNAFNFKELQYVKFFGGEPLFTDTHLMFLKTINNPENVTLHYTTNGSIFPSEETLAMWNRFKTIIFAASIDGIGQQFDYIRWPLSWTKVSNNLLRLRAQKLHNVMFRVEFTVNFLNAWYFNEIHDWVRDNWNVNEFGDLTELNLHPCVSVFDLQCMPQSLRDEVLKKYPAGHMIHNMISNLGEPENLERFIKFTQTWDPRRRQDWRQVFKDIAHLVDPNTKIINK